MATHFNTQRIHLSKDLFLSDILIFVNIMKEKMLCVALWSASAEGACHTVIMLLTLCYHGSKRPCGDQSPKLTISTCLHNYYLHNK